MEPPPSRRGRLLTRWLACCVRCGPLQVCALPSPESLLQALRELDASKLKPYVRGDAAGLVSAIDKLMGF